MFETPAGVTVFPARTTSVLHNGNYECDHAFLWQNGVMQSLTTGASYNYASAINDSGQVAGELRCLARRSCD